MPEVFNMDKPVVLTYEEIFSSTDGFSDSNLLGYKTYGSVYYGLLRDQVCGCILLSSKSDKCFARRKKNVHVNHYSDIVFGMYFKSFRKLPLRE